MACRYLHRKRGRIEVIQPHEPNRDVDVEVYCKHPDAPEVVDQPMKPDEVEKCEQHQEGSPRWCGRP